MGVERAVVDDWERFAERHWRALLLIAWAAIAGYMLWYKGHAIWWFSLGDTDDNMRFLQVRDWLHGQSWFDLRQHRMNPPAGASIHWTRLVDLPIAAIVLLVRPVLGEHDAWYVAVAIAPLIPLLVVILGLGVTARRLIGPAAAPVAAMLFACGVAGMMMFMPLRIDHHNWQLACLAWSVAGIADPRRARGGATVGIASAASMTIGLELVPYAAMAAGATALRWVWDRADAPRLLALGATLAGGCAAGFLVFASYDNRQPVCDALSPVWLSVAAGGGGLLVLASLLSVASRQLRLLVAGAVAAAVAIFYVLAWPKCVGMLEGISPELRQLWFNNVREAKPLTTQPWRVAAGVIALPLSGLAGAVLAAWNARARPVFAAWAAVALFTLFALGMLLWQTRAGPSAQLLAVPGAAWIVLRLVPPLAAARTMPVRVLGPVAAVMLASGLWVFFAMGLVPEPAAKPVMRKVNTANRLCPTLPAMAALERLPPATFFTFVDLGPRLIAVTHHRVIAGPYHRNGAAILDVHHAFRGTPDQAHAILARRRVDYLLICPGMNESTIYRARAPRGFYSQLAEGRVPDWLAPVSLPPNSPFRLWRVVG